MILDSNEYFVIDYKKRTFRLKEIVKIFGVNRHFVIHLAEKKIVEPLHDIKGRGKSRVYSYGNLIEIGIFIQLNKFNLSYEKAKEILEAARRQVDLGFEKLIKLFYVAIIGFVDGGVETVKVFGSISPMEEVSHPIKPGEKAKKLIDQKPRIVIFRDSLIFGEKFDPDALESSWINTYDYYDAEIQPEKALKAIIEHVTYERSNMTDKDIAYCFILNVLNIKDYIDSKISEN